MFHTPKSWANRLPAPLRRLLFADPGRELLRQADAVLLVFGDQLLHAETGAVAGFRSRAGEADAAALAACARELLGAGKDRSILLLLPPREFAATGVDMPGISGADLRAALLLQTETLLPATEEALELAAHGSADGAQVALWIKSQRIEALHEAFAAEGLFLAAVKPRVLHSRAPRSGLVDADDAELTFVRSSAGVLRQWKHVAAADLEQEEFAAQWDGELRAAAAGDSRRIDSIAHYAAALDREAHADYSFFPRAAAALRRRKERRRHALLAAAALGLTALLAAAPFIIQQFEISELNGQLETRRGLSAPARANREVVVDFENRWNAIRDFPDQDAREAMFALQQVLSPNRLSDLEISEGLIRIQGASEDPQSILQQLEQDPNFIEVVFSRATSNNQYYIDLRLADINFEAYMARYFPDR